jgi:ABC-type Fe3+ transport system permease subunit
MKGQHSGFRGAAFLGILLLSAIAAVVAYNIGVSHGLAQQLAAQGAQLPPYPYPYGWYRPWGFGFGFPILFFVLIWLVAVRGLFWGRRWRHGYYAGGYGVPPAFEEWHRQAHDRLKENRPADDPGSRG